MHRLSGTDTLLCGRLLGARPLLRRLLRPRARLLLSGPGLCRPVDRAGLQLRRRRPRASLAIRTKGRPPGGRLSRGATMTMVERAKQKSGNSGIGALVVALALLSIL